MKRMLSVVVPCYNEEAALPAFYKEIHAVAEEMRAYDFEFVFVDDGSGDGTLAGIKAFARADARVRYLSFSRNFGKEAAILAGLRASKGALVAVMDADLQDPPKLLMEMARIIEEEEYDCVATRRETRTGEPALKSFFSRAFYRLMAKISKTQIVDGARDFRLMRRVMVDAVLSLPEVNRFSKGIFPWVGFRTKWLSYENRARVAGKTKWSFWKLFTYSLDGIAAFSTAPLALASLMGLIFCAVAFLMILVIIVRTLIWGDPVSGWPSMICVIMLIGGVQLFCIGILGQYLSKVYLETKHRPIYILRETSDDTPEADGK